MNKKSFTKEQVAQAFQGIQESICLGLEAEDGKSKFSRENWDMKTGGGGLTRVISHGNVFEKGGVNFSAVEGHLPSFMKNKCHPDAQHFFATGVSIVIHPQSPMVPIVHMNIRYFETDKGDAWFGGGIDLTPIYVVDEQARFFHEKMKETCDHFHPDFYSKFKTWADDYFFITHRKETRGVGGIFYDDMSGSGDTSLDKIFEFTQAVGNTFLKAYVPIVSRNKNLAYTAENIQWQRIRRGRYVEFNLVYDKGTRFGLETGGRIESILMSLPEHASWLYDHQPAENSPEYLSQQKFVKGRNWVA
jgi:coproporphyrinogen III oxidase